MAIRKGRWGWVALAALAVWGNVLVVCVGFGLVCANVEYGWIRAGPVRATTRHPPAPGVVAQERDETHWLIGRGCVARVNMVVTTLDFARPGSRGNSMALAWHHAEAMPSVLPTIAESPRGPFASGPLKVPGWFPASAWAVATGVAAVCWGGWCVVRRACANPPAG